MQFTRIVNSESYSEINNFYKDVYSLRLLGSSFQDRIILLSLICYLTSKAKEKKPGVTTYQIITTVCKDSPLDDESAWALSIITNDLMYGCKDFSTFGIKKEDIIPTIQRILRNWLPF